MDFFYEIFEHLPRQGPGSPEITKRAFECIPQRIKSPVILDAGCGTGSQTIDIASLAGGTVYAVDNYKPFLDILENNAKQKKLEDKIKTVHASMDSLPFDKNFFDIIWAEGSIYNIGFERGLSYFKKFLKPGGYLACSDVVWLKDNPPAEIKNYWDNEYPAITDKSSCIKKIESAGYKLTDSFVLPKNAWTDDYYDPMSKLIYKYNEKYKDNSEVISFLNSLENEINIFKKYYHWFGYMFFIMRK